MGADTRRNLRVAPTRKRQDGTFLDELVRLGLIAVPAKPRPLPRRDEAGYGEYDRPDTHR